VFSIDYRQRDSKKRKHGLAAHFPLQQQKYAKEHTTDSQRRGISFAIPGRAFASSEAASEKTPPLKTQHFSRGLFTNGLHVRIQIGEPVCFSNSNIAGERCESAKRMKIQLDARCNESRICCSLIYHPI
jgi:hypothetical protein